MKVTELQRGDLVIAMKTLDIREAKVPVGTLGVVFEDCRNNKFAKVRWMNTMACNIHNGDAAWFNPRHPKGCDFIVPLI